MDEKRRYKRVRLSFPVECRGKNYWQYIESVDISAGGMFLATEKIEPINTVVELMFEIGKDGAKKFIRADAMVAWVRNEPMKDEKGNVILPRGMGIQFTKINPNKGGEFIDELVRKIEENK